VFGLSQAKLDVALRMGLADFEVGAGFLVLETSERLIRLNLVSRPDEAFLEEASSRRREDRRPLVF